jgi:hypothetical protein
MQRAAIRPEGAEPGTPEPALLKPSVEATCPPEDGAGAGAAGGGEPAGIGEDVEMAEMHEPTMLEPSVEATCPPGDGAGAGAAGVGGPAGVGEDIEMAEMHEPAVLEPSVEAMLPPGDGAGAGAAGAGGPARVGEDVEMSDGEDGYRNPFATFIQPTNQEEYSETSTDAGSIYSPSDER